MAGLDPSTGTSIQVRAVAGLDNSGVPRAGEASSVDVPRVPGPLVAVTGLTATPGSAQVELAWTAHPDFRVSYEVSQDGGSSWAAISGSDGLTVMHTVTGLSNGTAYRFGIRAVRSGIRGVAAWASATPVAAGTDAENPTVSVRADLLEVSGGGLVTLSGSGSVSGGTVTFAWTASPAVGSFADASAAETIWTAPAATASEQSVTLTLTASATGPARMASASLVVKVAALVEPPANRAPSIERLSTQPANTEMVMHGPPLSATVTASDADGDALTYWASSSNVAVVTVMPGAATDLASDAGSVIWVTQQGAGTATVT